MKANVSTPGLITPSTPLDGTTRTDYAGHHHEQPRRRVNVNRNVSQIAINPQDHVEARERPLSSGRGLSRGTYEKNVTSFRLWDSNLNAERENDGGEKMREQRTGAKFERSTMSHSHISGDHPLVSDGLKTYVHHEARKSTGHSPKKSGLRSLRDPLHDTSSVPYLQTSERRKEEYVGKNKHSEDTKWFRKKVEHDSPVLRRKMNGSLRVDW